MIQQRLHELSVLVEHRLKNLGLWTGVFVVLVVFPALWAIDEYLIQGAVIVADYNQLVSIANILIALLISLLATTFSVVFVVMQLASSQFSPRILRYFVYSDLRIQRFIGVYLGAIALILLPQVVRACQPQQTLQVTMLSALVLGAWCLMVSFPSMVVHLNDNMNVATITNRIKDQVLVEIEALYTQNWQLGQPLLYKRCHRDATKPYLNFSWPGASGYLESVDFGLLDESVQRFARQYPQIKIAAVHQKPIIGEFILSRTTVMLSLELEPLPYPDLEQILRQYFQPIILRTFSVYKYRSYRQDVNFGVRKLVDIAIKAISPAVNDPTTCLNCLDYIGEIVRHLNDKQFPSTKTSVLTTQRIIVNEFGFDELVDFCFDQIYQWGKNDPTVVKRMIRTIRQILPHATNPYNLMVLIRQLEEMELTRIYTLDNEARIHSKEQIRTIRQELEKFTEKARAQIAALQQNGTLARYALQSDESANLSLIRQTEVDAVTYLIGY
jgi:uncharacterized membrane protein